MMALLAGGAVLYALLHVALPERPPTDAPGCTSELGPDCFGRVDELGDVELASPGDVDWYVGADEARRVREQAERNSREMDALRSAVVLRAGSRIAPLLLDRAPVDALIREVGRGEYAAAGQTFAGIVDSLSTASANVEAVALAEIGADLARLAVLERHQHALVARLTPPLARLFFWTSPAYSMLEVLFFALFGVLTNLLVNATEHLRKGDFHPPERWVAYTKLLYGPIIALILVFAMIHGFLRPESYEVRVWTLPGVSFLFGYASRRIARLIDSLLERVLGVADPAAREEPGPVTAERRDLVEKLAKAYRPRDLRELRQQLKELAHEAVEAEAAAREGR